MAHSVLRVTTSSGVQVYKVNDIVKLDTKPIIYGKVLHFVKVAKTNEVDKVVVERQPEEVSRCQRIKFVFSLKFFAWFCHSALDDRATEVILFYKIIKIVRAL